MSDLSSVIFGRYIPGSSTLHRMDPRVKLTLTVAYMVASVLADNAIGVAVMAVWLIAAIALSGISAKDVFKSARPLLFILVITALINLFAASDGTVYWHWAFLTISSQGLHNMVLFTIRVALMLFSATLLTLTTTPIDMAHGIERILSPFARFGFPAEELAMMTSIAFRFVPTFVEEGIKVKQAQESRGAAFDEGGPLHRVKLLSTLIVPLFASAFRHAETLSQAMDSRCYRGGEGRTRRHELKAGRADWVAVVATVALVVVLAVL